MAPAGKNHSFPVEPLQEIIRLPQYRFQHKGQEGTVLYLSWLKFDGEVDEHERR